MTSKHEAPNAQNRRTELTLRVQTALIIGPITIVLLWMGSPVLDVALFVIGSLALREWIENLFALPRQVWWVSSAMLALILGAHLVTFVGNGGFQTAIPVLSGCVVLLFLLPRPWGAASAAAGLLYIGLAVLCAAALRSIPDVGFTLLLFTVLTVIATDIGAYFVGRMIGGPKLAPHISPGKTWSGLAGGMLFAAALGFGYAEGFQTASFATSGYMFAGLGVVLACVSQAGDLLESHLKRRRGLKDSGNLLPGHGGLLDRLDGHFPALILSCFLFMFLHV